jgi:nicotinate-nucleotide--dimethylbenzimidazole phosphoribosyltransferase
MLAAPTREGLAEAIAARRDVRRFRADEVPDDVLARVLAAGHAAPSVGHCQPWRFVVVRSAATREAAAVLADRERLRQAAGMTAEAARHLLSLRLEGLREAPVGVVMCCDRRARAAGVLGRASFPDADMWSCAAAVQNMWLTARAEGLGLGWVTLLPPPGLAALLGLPAGVETLGWLCLGWPDERPPGPGLERAGWSQRLPLSDVVLYERWPALPGEPASPVDRSAPAGEPMISSATRVRALDADDALLAVPGGLGLLGDVLSSLAGLPRPPGGGRGALVIAAADHPVTACGVSGFPASTTRIVATALGAGQAMGAVAARAAGLDLVLIDAGVDGGLVPGWRDCRPTRPGGNLAYADALHAEDAERLLRDGVAMGDTLAAAGVIALGEVGIGNTTVAAAVAAALTGAAVHEVVGRGAGSDSAGVARKRSVVSQALARTGYGTPITALDWTDLIRLLAGLGGGEVCVLVGVILGAALAGAPVVLDGLLTGAAALAAVRHDPRVRAALVAGQRSAEPGHALVLRELGLEPLLDLRLRAGEGVGAALATGVLAVGQRLREDTCRTA